MRVEIELMKGVVVETVTKRVIDSYSTSKSILGSYYSHHDTNSTRDKVNIESKEYFLVSLSKYTLPVLMGKELGETIKVRALN